MIIDASAEKRRSKWEDSPLVFIVLPIVLILFIPTGGLLYIWGRMNFHPGLIIVILYPASGIFIIFCFIKVVVRLVRNWRGDMKFLLFTQFLLPLAFIILAVIMPPVLVKSPLWPDAPAFLSGFTDRIRNKADIPAIRDWLKKLDKDEYEGHVIRLPFDKLPESLKALYSYSTSLEGDHNGNPRVDITYGGGFFHWGEIIGMEDMEIPPSELNDRYESWLLIEPGVYVYDW